MEVLKTGTYHNEFFTVTGIKANVPRMVTYLSKGERKKQGTCYGVNYVRGDVAYKQAYERKHSNNPYTGNFLGNDDGFDP